MRRFMFIMMLCVLGTFSVKGFTSVCPTIKTDGIEIKSDYSCDQVDLLSETVLDTDLNTVIDVGKCILTDNSVAIVNLPKERATLIPGIVKMPSTFLKGQLKPPKCAKNEINYTLSTSSGGMPYTPVVLS